MKFQKVHIGSLVKMEVKRCGMTFTEFAKHIGIQKQNVERKVFKQQGLNTDLLILISEILNYDFFRHFQNDTICNHSRLQREIKATLTFEIGDKKQDRELILVFGGNEIKIEDNCSPKSPPPPPKAGVLNSEHLSHS